MMVPYVIPLVDEITVLMPQILTQMLDRTVELSSHRAWNAEFLRPKRWPRRSCPATTTKRKSWVRRWDREEGDDPQGPYLAELCNDWQGTERFHPGTGLLIRCTTRMWLQCETSSWTWAMWRCRTKMIVCPAAWRSKRTTRSRQTCSITSAWHLTCLWRQRTRTPSTKCAFDVRDQGFHWQGTAHEDAEECHADQHGMPRGGVRGRELEVLSARTDFCYLSDAPARDNADLKTCREQSVVIMNTPGQNVNVVAELVCDMIVHSGFEVALRWCVFYTNPSSTWSRTCHGQTQLTSWSQPWWLREPRGMTPQPDAARRKSDEDSAAVVQKGPSQPGVETTAHKSSQCSTPASAGSMSTQQGFDKVAWETVRLRTSTPSSSSASSPRRERDVVTKLSSARRCGSTTWTSAPASCRTGPASSRCSGALSRERIPSEDEAWRLVCVCEDRQSESYHNGTTGQTFDSPRQLDSSTIWRQTRTRSWSLSQPLDAREAFADEDMDDTETVALI